MYRAPRSSGGGSGVLLLVLLLIGAFYLAACDVPTDPAGIDSPASAALDVADETDPDVAIAADPALTELAVSDVAAELGPNPGPTATIHLDDARSAFDDADASYRRGDRAGARDHGRRGREALARALAEQGEEVIRDWIVRLESIRDHLAEEADDYHRIDALRAELDRLTSLAREALDDGDLVQAAEHVVEARLRVDHSRRQRHRRRPERDRPHHARLAVARAHQAVSLAGRLLEDVGATERQLHLLAQAARHAERAQAAYEREAHGMAVVHANKAVNTALWAYLHPEVTEEKARTVASATQALVDAAVAAIGIDGDSTKSQLLRRVVHLFEEGLAALEEGNLRGVRALWHAGVTAGALTPSP